MSQQDQYFWMVTWIEHPKPKVECVHGLVGSLGEAMTIAKKISELVGQRDSRPRVQVCRHPFGACMRLVDGDWITEPGSHFAAA